MIKNIREIPPFIAILTIITLFFIVSLIGSLPNFLAHSTEWKNEHIQFKVGKQVIPQFQDQKIRAVVAIQNNSSLMVGEHCLIRNDPGTLLKIVGRAQAPDYRYLLVDETSAFLPRSNSCWRAAVFVSPEDFQSLRLAADTSVSPADIRKKREKMAEASRKRMETEIESVRLVGK